jgi:hypothetical protein
LCERSECGEGFQDGGDGRCVAEGQCSSCFEPNDDGGCDRRYVGVGFSGAFGVAGGGVIGVAPGDRVVGHAISDLKAEAEAVEGDRNRTRYRTIDPPTGIWLATHRDVFGIDYDNGKLIIIAPISDPADAYADLGRSWPRSSCEPSFFEP